MGKLTKAVNSRTGTGYPHQLYGHQKNLDERNKGANNFMKAAAIAYNLKKWLNYKQIKTTTGVMALKKPSNAAFTTPHYTVLPAAQYK